MDAKLDEAKIAKIESTPATQRRVDTEALKAQAAGEDPIGGGDKCVCGRTIIWTTEKVEGSGAVRSGECNRCHTKYP